MVVAVIDCAPVVVTAPEKRAVVAAEIVRNEAVRKSYLGNTFDGDEFDDR